MILIAPEMYDDVKVAQIFYGPNLFFENCEEKKSITSA